jgi:DNA repair exonuclease SbcCD ATPase subunit
VEKELWAVLSATLLRTLGKRSEQPTHRFQMNYPGDMDHLEVLREKIERLRQEIAQIQRLNQRFRFRESNDAAANVAHEQRQNRLEAIQQELTQLAGLGRKVLSVEEAKENHRSRLHLVKKVS